MTRKADQKMLDEEDGMTKEEQETAQLEEERRSLQIQLMKDEKNQKKYAIAAQDKIRRQRYELRLLQREREEIMKDLHNSESDRNHRRQKSCCRTIDSLMEQKEGKEAELEAEIIKIKELDREVQEWERRVAEKNKEMGGTLALKQHTKKTRHQGRVLENRLENATERLDKQVTRNRKLRDLIDVFRTDRKRDDEILSRMEKVLEMMKKEAKNITEASRHEMDLRDEANQKMILLREKSSKEKKVTEVETKELRRLLDHDRKIKEFMSIKEKERQEDEQQVQWKKKIVKHIFEKVGDPEIEHRIELNDAFEQLKILMVETDINVVVQRTLITADFENCAVALQDFCESHSYSASRRYPSRFIDGEEENFGLFQLVNELNNQQEHLQEECHEVQIKVKDFEEDIARRENDRKGILNELDLKVQAIAKEADFVHNKDRVVLKILDQLRIGIKKLFRTIKCDRTAIDALLGSSKDVQFHNMPIYLGAIEKRTNELVDMSAFVKDQAEQDDDGWPSRPSEIPEIRRGTTGRQSISGWLHTNGSGPPQPGGVIPPDMNDEVDSFGVDSELHPLTRLELEMKINKAMHRRGKLHQEALRTSAELVSLHQPAQESKRTRMPQRSVKINRGSASPTHSLK